jgi:hypothetical protein
MSLGVGGLIGLTRNLLRASRYRRGWGEVHASQDQKGGDGEDDGSGRKTSDRDRKSDA